MDFNLSRLQSPTIKWPDAAQKTAASPFPALTRFRTDSRASEALSTLDTRYVALARQAASREPRSIVTGMLGLHEPA